MTYKEPISGVIPCINYLLNNYDFKTVIDIGCGYSPYRSLFDSKIYTGIDIIADNSDKRFIKNNFMTHDFFDKKYDCVFSSHCIEHIADTELFLRKIKSLFKVKGVICILFPKPKHEIVGGHVHIFNPGLLLYNLVRIGFDCKNTICVDNGYTYGIIGNIEIVEETPLIYDRGDIELLAHLFPFNAFQNFNGITETHLKRI